jgi:hypothetical protein
VISCTSPLSAEAVSEEESEVSVLPESVEPELDEPELLPQPLKSVATIATDKSVAKTFFLIENPPYLFVIINGLHMREWI